MEDGYRCAEICDAIVRSHETGQRAGDRVPHAMTTSRSCHRRVAGHRPGDGRRARPGRRRRRRQLPAGRRAGGAGGGRGDRRGRRGARPAMRARRGRRRRSAHVGRAGSRGRARRARAGSTSGSTTPRGCWCSRSSRPPTRTGHRSCGSNVHGLRATAAAPPIRQMLEGRRRPDRQHHVGRAPAADRRPSAYCTAKGGMLALTQTLAVEFGGRTGSRSTRSRRERPTRR